MILLLGSSGYVGRIFTSELQRRGCAFIPLTRQAVDYTSFGLLFDHVRKTRPAFIINAAGYAGNPDVDACELAREETLFANAILPQTIEKVCGFTEWDEPNFSFRRAPCNFYSGTKALAEEAIRGVGQSYIWRLGTPFNECDESGNFLWRIQNYTRLYDGVNSLSHTGDFVR